MTRHERARLGGALLLGAAVAFPAGLLLGGGGGDGARAPAPRGSAAVRDAFSPRVQSDPYFLDRQRDNVAALEAHCEETGELCAEAGAARRRSDELAAGQ